jgi:hypothetical protein
MDAPRPPAFGVSPTCADATQKDIHLLLVASHIALKRQLSGRSTEPSQAVGSVRGMSTKAITPRLADRLNRRLLAASQLQIQAARSVALDGELEGARCSTP